MVDSCPLKSQQQKKYKVLPWLVWLCWLEGGPLCLKATSSIPGQGTRVGCVFDPRSRPYGRQPINVSLWHWSFFPPLPKKINEHILKWELKEKNLQKKEHTKYKKNSFLPTYPWGNQALRRVCDGKKYLH